MCEQLFIVMRNDLIVIGHYLRLTLKLGKGNRLTLLKLNSSLNKDSLFAARMENLNQPENWLIFQANSKIR